MQQSKINFLRNLLHTYICFSILYIATSLGNDDLKQWTEDSRLIGLPILSAFIGFAISLIWEGFWNWKTKAPISENDILFGTLSGLVGGMVGMYFPGTTWLLISLAAGVVLILFLEYQSKKKLL